MINVSWAKGTREGYGARLLVYHIFCDSCNIVEDNRAPTSPLLITTFISSCAWAYAGSTLVNYVFTVWAWHVLHGLTWSMDDTQVKAALMGAAILAPPTSKCPKRVPITVGLMEHIFGRLDLTDPLDVAVAGCFSTIFYSVAHTGEFTLTPLILCGMSSHLTYPTGQIATTWKSQSFISLEPSALQKVRMCSGHVRTESQIPRLLSITTSKPTPNQQSSGRWTTFHIQTCQRIMSID